MRRIVASLIVGLGACSGPAGSPGMADAPVAAMPGPCTFLEGKTFTATEDRECGLGPNGPVPCRWHVQFESAGGAASSFTWGHSDVEESGTLSCVGFAITVMDQVSPTLAASFDGTTQVLTWDDLDYN